MMASSSSVISRNCPLCESHESRIVLELPATPLGDRFAAEENEAKSLVLYPLQVDRCSACGHCFVPYLTEPDDSYQHYLFQSSQSPGLTASFAEIVHDLALRHGLNREDLVLDIGANDGSWLSCFHQMGCALLAVEPAPGPAEIASEHGISVINNYFTEEAVRDTGLLVKPPRLVSMNYVFANLPEPLKILKDIAKISDQNTIISILTGYHPAQLEVAMFDYVYHEHLSYYSCSDFKHMAESIGYVITYCREVPLKGGSIHIEMRKAGPGVKQSTLFATMSKRESWLDHPCSRQWENISAQIKNTGEQTRATINKARADGYSIVGYGASHSTTTLAYALGIEASLDLIIDDNPSKQSRYSPGAGIPVLSPLALEGNGLACVVILGWQHGPQIIEQLKERDFHGLVLTPFPSFSVEELT